MKMISESYRSISFVTFLYADRLIMIAMITAALALAGQLFDYPTVS